MFYFQFLSFYLIDIRYEYIITRTGGILSSRNTDCVLSFDRVWWEKNKEVTHVCIGKILLLYKEEKDDDTSSCFLFLRSE